MYRVKILKRQDRSKCPSFNPWRLHLPGRKINPETGSVLSLRILVNRKTRYDCSPGEKIPEIQPELTKYAQLQHKIISLQRLSRRHIFWTAVCIRKQEILLPGADMTLFLEGDIEKNEDPDKANTEKKGDKI